MSTNSTHEYDANCICDTCLEHGSHLADEFAIAEFERWMEETSA